MMGVFWTFLGCALFVGNAIISASYERDSKTKMMVFHGAMAVFVLLALVSA